MTLYQRLPKPEFLDKIFRYP